MTTTSGSSAAELPQKAQKPDKKHQKISPPNISRSYNAIKLTNYFTNLLEQKRLHQLESRPLASAPNATGESWRTRQLAYQIPHQDIKLLAHDSRLASDAMTTTTSHHEHHDGEHQQQTLSDEIKFIRGQRKMASKFKASLYYLNPTAAKAAPNSSYKSGPSSSPQQHSCFKVS